MAATKTRKSRKPSAAQTAAAEARKAERAALAQSLKDAADAFELDEENPGMVRAFESLTSHYSEGNAVLILAQAAQQGRRVRGLQDVGGFGTWGDRGRSVKKGEHQSIFIWAKAGTAERDDATVTPQAEAGPATATTSTEKTRTFFRVVGLFHVSQTEDAAVAKARRAALAGE